MPEEKDQEIQESLEGKEAQNDAKVVPNAAEKSENEKLVKEVQESPVDMEKSEEAQAVSDTGEQKETVAPTEAKEVQDDPKVVSDSGDLSGKEASTSEKSDDETDKKAKERDEEKVLAEIDEENAEDAEDHYNKHRHHIPLLDYHSMPMENLVGELQRLVRNEKVQAIKKHVDGIKYEFDLKFQDFIEGKKEEFISGGGNEIDFKYNSNTKRQFNEVYADYREKRDQYYKNLENTLKENLTKRLEIIEGIKGLVNVEEDINTTYKNFKELQERWRGAGPVPRNNYNDVWRTYQHHIEIFYDFLHLNRELRDLDFKHNLEEKTKLVERAEALANEKDLGKAFRDLQQLHKIWKEEIGPVDREHRDAIWERFSNATKILHQRRQEHQKELDTLYEENLVQKNGIISKISAIADAVANNHRALQQQIREIGELRDAFFKAGKVPQHSNEATWTAFKGATRKFNHNKNTFYKNLKKEQQQNLDKKRELLALAVSLKDSEEWEMATQEMKRIQSDWKKIGHVPRKFSDSIWKEFKTACNHYFDRLHALKNSAHKEEAENLVKKTACLERLRAFAPSGERSADLEKVKEFIAEWKGYGRVPFKQKNIDQKFNKTLDALFKKMDVGRQESELLRYGNKIHRLSKAEDSGRALSNERQFIRKKIEESKSQIRQLENNMQFFSNTSEDSPLVKEVVKNLNGHKEALETWKGKLKKLNIMANNLNKAAEEDDAAEAARSEEE